MSNILYFLDSIEIFKSYSIGTIKEKKLSAITLYTNEKNTLIITGDFFGNIDSYEITSKNKLNKNNSIL